MLLADHRETKSRKVVHMSEQAAEQNRERGTEEAEAQREKQYICPAEQEAAGQPEEQHRERERSARTKGKAQEGAVEQIKQSHNIYRLISESNSDCRLIVLDAVVFDYSTYIYITRYRSIERQRHREAKPKQRKYHFPAKKTKKPEIKNNKFLGARLQVHTQISRWSAEEFPIR